MMILHGRTDVQEAGAGRFRRLIADRQQWTRLLVAAVVALTMLFPALSGVQAQDDEEDNGAWFRSPSSPHDGILLDAPIRSNGQVVVSLHRPSVYDPFSGEWQVGTHNPHVEEVQEGILFGWRPRLAVALGDGRVFAAGGSFRFGLGPRSGAATLAATYDPSSDQWIEAAEMHQSRLDPTVSLLPDGSVLVAGGDHESGVGSGSGNSVRESAERYYPDENRWELIDEMNEGRHRHSAITLPDGRVLVVGGQTEGRGRPSTVEAFDPATNSWEVVATDVPDDVLGHAAVLLDDERILITGGSTVNPLGGPEEVHASSWILDLTDGDLDEAEPMLVPRSGHSATLLPSGKVLVAGGLTEFGTDEGRTASTEIFDPEAGEWSPAADMLEARADHSAAKLDSSAQGAALYVGGGMPNDVDSDAPEVFYETAPSLADRQPPPADDDPAHRYFPATGHYLSYGFKDFWEASGGLPVFGYPLTTEFAEYNPDLDEDRTSQYVERQRFEYHPEHAGTPYETQLGRLGYADAADRGLLESDAFEQVDEESLGAECRYFAQTGQAACGAFLSYWQSHGLDFGDDGVSFRESLALFGYPISRQFTDPDTGLTTQYFERAVFEFHPDNPEEHQVLLRRLGAEIVEQRDW